MILIKRTSLLILWCCLACLPDLGAQYQAKENAVWVFGDYTGIDFNTGSPVPIRTTVWGFGSANASVASAQGRLLFYTNGSAVWDSTHVQMSRGYNLTGIVSPSPVISPPPASESSSQGALITSAPGDPWLYYIFSLSSNEWGDRAGRLYYSLVDMRLNQGKGDIVAAEKGVFIGGGYTEHMTAIPGDNCNIWILVHDRSSEVFHAYEITAAGVRTAPVVSQAGIPGVHMVGGRNVYWSTGTLSVSQDRRQIAGAYFLGSLLELYDFDPGTGQVSHARVVDQSAPEGFFATCFSPDDSKLYAGSITQRMLFQYDLSQPTLAAVTASKTSVGGFDELTILRLGPDGKLYYARSRSSRTDISRIEYPDQPGTSSQYTPVAVSVFYGSPRAANVRVLSPSAPFVSHRQPDTTARYLDTLVCGPMGRLTLEALPGFGEYDWDDGSRNSSRVVRERGSYRVVYRMEGSCHMRIDSFAVRGADLSFSLGADTVVCAPGAAVSLSVPLPGASYLWQDGSVSSQYTVRESGLYSVRVSAEGCTETDTVSIEFVSLAPDLGEDQVFCGQLPDVLTLEPRGIPDGAQLLWSDGSIDPVLRVADTGIFWVRVDYAQCLAADTIRVRTEKCSCSVYIPSAFTPNGDGKNDVFRVLVAPDCPVRSYALTVFNRWGQIVWSTADAGAAWDGTAGGKDSESGTYMYLMRFTGGTRSQEQTSSGEITLIR